MDKLKNETRNVSEIIKEIKETDLRTQEEDRQ